MAAPRACAVDVNISVHLDLALVLLKHCGNATDGCRHLRFASTAGASPKVHVRMPPIRCVLWFWVDSGPSPDTARAAAKDDKQAYPPTPGALSQCARSSAQKGP